MMIERSSYKYLNIQSDIIPDNPEGLYLDILKRCLCRALIAKSVARQTINPGRWYLRWINRIARAALTPLDLELVRLVHSSPEHYIESSHAARTRVEDAETMISMKQLDQVQICILDVISRNVPGDLLEAGVWRGGVTILMRAALRAFGDNKRRVWVADSFEGLPNPDAGSNSFGWRQGDMCVSLDEVRENFSRYGLLDEQVCFLPGFFSETLPRASIDKLSVLRVDADLYESTRDVLQSLYPKLSVGGYAIFDDYLNLKDCRQAVDEYRTQNGVHDPIVEIDKRAVYWVKSK